MSLENNDLAATERGTRYFAIICSAVSFFVYLGALQFHFVYDDVGVILDNPSVRSWRFLSQYFTSHVWAGVFVNSNYYRPLLLVWFRLNDALFGLNPAGWHLSSAIAHAIATLLIFHLVNRLFLNRDIAALSSLIFGLHPLHVQSVAWISGITDPLLTIFLVGSFLQYLNFRDSRKPRHLAWSLVLYAAATLTKEPAIILPAIIAAHELFASSRDGVRHNLTHRLRDASLAVVPFAAATILYLAVRAHALHGFAPALSPIGAVAMLRTLPSILWLYARHLVLPWGYSLYYDFRLVPHFSDPRFLLPTLGLILLGLILGATCYLLRVPRNLIVTACTWFAVPLLPSLYLPALAPEIYGQDRYLYLSLVGFSILAAALIVQFVQMIGPRERTASLLLYAGAIVGMTLACCTLIQQQYWNSNIALYQRAVGFAPENEQAVSNLAVALAEHKPTESLALFERCLRMDPNSAKLNYLYGYTLYRIGRYSPALLPLSRAAQIEPTMAEAFLYIGLSHLKLGYTEDAKFEIRRALALEPERRGAHLAMGSVLEAEGNLQGALEETRIEANNFPDDRLIHQRLLALEQKLN